MPHAYTEDQFVEQPTIGLFAELCRKVGLASEVENGNHSGAR